MKKQKKFAIFIALIIFIGVFIVTMLQIRKINNVNESLGDGGVDTSHYGIVTNEPDTIEIQTDEGWYTFIGENLRVLDPQGKEIEF